MSIVLKNRTRDHVVTFWNKTQDEEIKKLFPFSTESLEQSLSLFDESLKKGASSYGKVIYYEDKYVGDIWCYSIDENDEKMGMLSIVIFEKGMWGKGIGAEAAKIFIREVFDKFNIKKIGAFVYSNNYRSIGLLKNAGFAEVETFSEDGIESMYFELYLSDVYRH